MKKETSLKRFFKKLNVFKWLTDKLNDIDEDVAESIFMISMLSLFFVILCGGALMPRKQEVEQAECERCRVHITGVIKLEKPEEGGNR